MRTDNDVINPESARSVNDNRAERKRKRSSGNLILKVLRLSLKLMRLIAPGLSVKTVAWLFRTPLPTKLAQRKRKIPAGVKLETLAFEQATLTLYVYPASAEAPQILLTHGWAGYGLQLSELADALSAAGWAVILLDQPGHGRSAGWNSNLQQFSRALRFVAQRLSRLEALAGHSMGAAAACHAIVQGLTISKLALISSPVSLTQETREMAKTLGLSEAMLAETIAYIEAREEVPFATVEASYLAPRINAATLVVHDLDDRTVAFTAAQTLVAHLPATQLHITNGLGHRRLLKDPAVVSHIAQFFGQAGR